MRVSVLCTFGDPQLGLFSYGANESDSQAPDPFAIWKRVAERGWFTGLVTEPRGIHMMLSPAHEQVANDYLSDLREAVEEVRASGETAEKTRARYS